MLIDLCFVDPDTAHATVIQQGSPATTTGVVGVGEGLQQLGKHVGDLNNCSKAKAMKLCVWPVLEGLYNTHFFLDWVTHGQK